jgi:hypothetical protein
VRYGVIRFRVTSDGTTGKGWIARLEKKGFHIGYHAKSVLRSPDFKNTKGVTYEIAVLKGSLFADADRTTDGVRAEAKRRGLTVPDAEVACLIREKFSDDDLEVMGFWWLVTMHELIGDSRNMPRLLSVDRDGSGRLLDTALDKPGRVWKRDRGFVYVVS